MFMALFYKDQTIYNELFKNINSFSLFENRLRKLSKNKSELLGYDPGENGENKMKGDLFEIFIEGFIHLCGSHSSLCISSYVPVDIGSDNGVDGTGLCLRSKPLTVQIKYRSEVTYELKEPDLKQFWGQSIVKYGVDKDVIGNMVVITNCAGLHWYTHTTVLLEKARTISRKDIISIINNNKCFWDNMKIIMNETFKENLGDDFEYAWI